MVEENEKQRLLCIAKQLESHLKPHVDPQWFLLFAKPQRGAWDAKTNVRKTFERWNGKQFPCFGLLAFLRNLYAHRGQNIRAKKFDGVSAFENYVHARLPWIKSQLQLFQQNHLSELDARLFAGAAGAGAAAAAATTASAHIGPSRGQHGPSIREEGGSLDGRQPLTSRPEGGNHHHHNQHHHGGHVCVCGGCGGGGGEREGASRPGEHCAAKGTVQADDNATESGTAAAGYVPPICFAGDEPQWLKDARKISAAAYECQIVRDSRGDCGFRASDLAGGGVVIYDVGAAIYGRGARDWQQLIKVNGHPVFTLHDFNSLAEGQKQFSVTLLQMLDDDDEITTGI